MVDVLGFRSDGRPIYSISGGYSELQDMQDNPSTNPFDANGYLLPITQPAQVDSLLHSGLLTDLNTRDQFNVQAQTAYENAVPTPYVLPNTSVAGPWYYMGATPIGSSNTTPVPGLKNVFTGPNGKPSPLMNTLVDYGLHTGWSPTLQDPTGPAGGYEPQGMATVRGPISPEAAAALTWLEGELGAGHRVPISALQMAAHYLGNDWINKKKPRSLATNVGIGAGTTLGALAGSALGGPIGGGLGAAAANAGMQAAAQRSEPGTFNPYEVGAAGVSGAVGGWAQGAGPLVQGAARAGTSTLGNIAAQYGQTGHVDWPAVAANLGGSLVTAGVGNWLPTVGMPPIVANPVANVAGGLVSGTIDDRSRRNPYMDAATGVVNASPTLVYQGN